MHSSASTMHADVIDTLSLLGAQALKEIPSKAVLYHRGAPASGLYYLERGIIQLHSSGNSSDNFVFEVIVPGDVFGEESLSAAASYGAFATVLVRSSLRWIPPPLVNGQYSELAPEWSWIFDRLVCRHQRALERFSTLCSQDVTMRILSGLVELSQWCPATDGLEASLPQAPDPRLGRQIDRVVIAIAEPMRPQVVFERLQPRGKIFRTIAVELYAEQRPGIAVDEALSHGLERRALAGVIEDRLVHHLDG